MKRVFIIHGWGGTPNGDWYGWLKEKLKKEGFDAKCPEMPNTFNPKIDEWVSYLSKSVGNADEDTYFIGHSIGCQAIMRYLETLPNDTRIGGVIFVAGWIHLTDETWDEDYTPEIAEPWLKKPINLAKIRKHSPRFIDIASDNDPYVPLDDKDIFQKKLGAEIIVLHNKGHISGEDGIKDFPLLVKKLLELSEK
jgi:hypothetical protein